MEAIGLKELRGWIKEYPYYISEIDRIPKDQISDQNRQILKEYLTTSKKQTDIAKEFGLKPGNLRSHLLVAKFAFMRQVRKEKRK